MKYECLHTTYTMWWTRIQFECIINFNNVIMIVVNISVCIISKDNSNFVIGENACFSIKNKRIKPTGQ